MVSSEDKRDRAARTSRSSRASTRPTYTGWLAAGSVIVATPVRASSTSSCSGTSSGRADRGGEGLMAPDHASTACRSCFGETTAVNDLSLEVADGEFLVLVGPSGCGKTTALRCSPGSRRSRRDDPHRRPRRDQRARRSERDIAMVFQDYALYPQMSVAQEPRASALKMRKHAEGRDRAPRDRRRRAARARAAARAQAARALGRAAPARRARPRARARARRCS